VLVQADVLHTQLADPDGPLHVWCALGQAASAFQPVQPVAWTAHVSVPPLGPHCFVPAVQAFVQQTAAPGTPVHAPFAQELDPDAYQHFCASRVHETSVVPLLAQ
jgi:hypothetical protein